jgi:hypothetical protein
MSTPKIEGHYEAKQRAAEEAVTGSGDVPGMS